MRPVAVSAGLLACPKDWSLTGDKSRCYSAFTAPTPLSWSSAMDACTSMNSSLMTFHEVDDEPLAAFGQACWVGLRKHYTSNWFWVDDRAFEMPNMRTSSLRQRVSEERCGAVSASGLQDRPCSSQKVKCFVCATPWSLAGPEFTVALARKDWRSLSGLNPEAPLNPITLRALDELLRDESIRIWNPSLFGSEASREAEFYVAHASQGKSLDELEAPIMHRNQNAHAITSSRVKEEKPAASLEKSDSPDSNGSLIIRASDLRKSAEPLSAPLSELSATNDNRLGVSDFGDFLEDLVRETLGVISDEFLGPSNSTETSTAAPAKPAAQKHETNEGSRRSHGNHQSGKNQHSIGEKSDGSESGEKHSNTTTTTTATKLKTEASLDTTESTEAETDATENTSTSTTAPEADSAELKEVSERESGHQDGVHILDIEITTTSTATPTGVTVDIGITAAPIHTTPAAETTEVSTPRPITRTTLEEPSSPSDIPSSPPDFASKPENSEDVDDIFREELEELIVELIEELEEELDDLAEPADDFTMITTTSTTVVSSNSTVAETSKTPAAAVESAGPNDFMERGGFMPGFRGGPVFLMPPPDFPSDATRTSTKKSDSASDRTIADDTSAAAKGLENDEVHELNIIENFEDLVENVIDDFTNDSSPTKTTTTTAATTAAAAALLEESPANNMNVVLLDMTNQVGEELKVASSDGLTEAVELPIDSAPNELEGAAAAVLSLAQGIAVACGGLFMASIGGGLLWTLYLRNHRHAADEELVIRTQQLVV